MITLNEERAIRRVVEDIKKIVPDSEILIVDSSDDRTALIAKSLSVKVVRQYPPQGYGRAMDLALKSAKGDIIVTMDCDNTYPAESIPELVKWINEGFDLVNASRLLYQKPQSMPVTNYIANWLFAFVTRILFSIKTTDVHSGMRAYRREMIYKIDCDASGPALPVELFIKPIVAGYKFKEIGIDYKQRLGKVTLRRWSSTYWTFKRILRLKWQKLKTKENHWGAAGADK
jgi:glycosyltransferase involved in cell wall biosynthesis